MNESPISELEASLNALTLTSISTTLKPYQQKSVKRIQELERQFKGGLEISETGTGKTLKMIANMVNDGSNDNLVICPNHLIDNWVYEFKKHTNIKSSMINVFRGKNRVLKSGFFVTIISYTLAKHLVKANIAEDEWTTPHTNTWHRIILDEAHYIKNRETQTSRYCLELSEENPHAYKWVVTATPVMNSSDDSIPYLLFLGHLKYQNTSYYFNKFSIRDKKTELNLKGLTEKIIDLEPLPYEREYMKSLLEMFIGKVDKFNATKAKSSLLDVLSFLTKMRISCNGHTICNRDDECPVCYDNAASHKNSCNHAMCLRCWNFVKICPLCRKEKKTLKEVIYNSNDVTLHSSKLNKIKELVNLHKDEKIIISSQWLRSLDILKTGLNEITIFSITGKMPMSQRQEEIRRFRNHKGQCLFLLSLSCCAEGLTLTEATVVIHLERWWNKAKTDQMSSRIYRIGQENPCYVYYLQLKNSIEEKMYEMNIEKNKLSNYYLFTKNDKEYEGNVNVLANLRRWAIQKYSEI